MQPPTPVSKGRDNYMIVYTAKGLMRAKLPENKRSFANLHDHSNLQETRLGSPRCSEAVATRSIGTRNGDRAITTIPSRSGISRNLFPLSMTRDYSPVNSIHVGKESIKLPGSTRSNSRTGYKYNLSGRSVKACGAFGRSDSPASHSGMDPDMPRGKSSQLDFEICATEEQLNSIQKNLTKLIAIR